MRARSARKPIGIELLTLLLSLTLTYMIRSRICVEEEGEVFRKGTVLLGPEEMEGEYAGEELRKEVGITSSSIFFLSLIVPSEAP